jgi:hypothetical protein
MYAWNSRSGATLPTFSNWRTASSAIQRACCALAYWPAPFPLDLAGLLGDAEPTPNRSARPEELARDGAGPPRVPVHGARQTLLGAIDESLLGRGEREVLLRHRSGVRDLARADQDYGQDDAEGEPPTAS